jgi:hypothetical protein
MITIDEAFRKFRTCLETTDTEDAAASRRQQKIRGQLDESGAFTVVRTFLTGAYRRHTKTKPLRDVDIMIVLNDTRYLDLHPRKILEDIRDMLAPHYGEERVCTDRRAVRVDFGTEHVGDLSGDVVSFDVVPAFEDNGRYLIPDDQLGTWIPTNPEVHAELATAANQRFDGQWKPLVKMIKKWNQVNGSPVEPSFLIEVMALDLISGPWTGSHPRELRQFFASAADRIADRWPDPAHAGPDISDSLDSDPAKMGTARKALQEAERACTQAIRLDRDGRTGDALATWRSLFGNLFPLS